MAVDLLAVNDEVPTLRIRNFRTAPRYRCTEPPLVRVAFKPRFSPLPLRLLNISSNGVGLVCEARLRAGERLAIAWQYGPPQRWRTLLGRVVHVTPRQQGDWVIGCELDIPLAEADLAAFLSAAGETRQY